MNSKVIRFFKNMSYTLTSNIISLLISTFVSLIIPKLIGVEQYGYWQLYLFYASYTGVFLFGWNDGIYLRLGGEDYKKINKKLYFSQFSMALIFQIIIAILIQLYSYIYISDPNRKFIFTTIIFSMLFTNMQAILTFILQATNRIKEYSVITMANRVIYFLVLLTFVFVGIRQYEYMIVADLIGKFLSLSIAIYYCKEITFNNVTDFYFDFKEMYSNISTGIKLMFANFASMLVIGIVRFGIEQNWDVETFGKISLTLSISNMMMLFINAIGLVLFPVLRRINKKQYTKIYALMRDFLMVISLGLLIFYYPAKILLSNWLPKYADALNYMALLFPLFIFEGKMSLLINTFLKTMRKETLLLKINIVTVSISLIVTIITAYVLKNLDLAIVSIVILLAFRSVFAEYQMSKLLDISVFKDVSLELILTLAFILSGWFIDSWMTTLIYSMLYLTYLYLKKKDTKNSFQVIIQMVKK